MSIFWEGFLWGLSLAFLLGPAFFALIQTSIKRGLKYGLLLAFGIFLSDLIAITLVYLGATNILGEDPRDNIYFSVIGGVILVIFGTYTIVKRDNELSPGTQNGEISNAPSRPAVYISKGFLMNFFNPGMWFFWITVTVSITARFGANSRLSMLFLAGMLISVITMDSVKCLISNKISKWMTPRYMHWMNMLVGVILILFGVYLILNVLFDVSRYIPGSH